MNKQKTVAQDSESEISESSSHDLEKEFDIKLKEAVNREARIKER